MPIGTAVHERTFALCESLNYREWSGYYAVSAYESHHEHEYNAIRNAAALIDISPLFKYHVTGRDATRLVDRVITTSKARSSMTGRSRGWESRRIDGPQPIPVCDGFGKTPWGWMSKSKMSQNGLRPWRSRGPCPRASCGQRRRLMSSR